MEPGQKGGIEGEMKAEKKGTGWDEDKRDRKLEQGDRKTERKRGREREKEMRI